MNPADLVRAQIATLRLNHPELVEDEEAWLLSLVSETDLDGLLRAIERRRQEAAVLRDSLHEHIDNLTERRHRFARRANSCRDLMLKLMQAADLKTRELPEATLSVTNGKPSVVITDFIAIPSGYLRVKHEANRDSIKTDLEAGKTIPGAVLSNAEPHLTIRTK